MFGIKELKENLKISKTFIECPVKGCGEKVERQKRVFKKEERFKCQKHKIYISPTTFEYESELDNLLWKGQDDLDLFNKIKVVKRESRIGRDNSEDAVTWNVFRFMERNNLIEKILNPVIGGNLKSSEVIYWSYSQKENHTWSKLNEAREEFGEKMGRGSEPDVIIQTDGTLLFIEAKFTSGNNTLGKMENSNKYEIGGNKWFFKVFKSDYKTIAVVEKKYELLRLWLIGTWIAEKYGLNFYLVNLVLSKREENIEEIFKKHISEDSSRKFIRISWEEIYKQILKTNSTGIDKDMIIKYFKNKTVGYRNRKLQTAFSI